MHLCFHYFTLSTHTHTFHPHTPTLPTPHPHSPLSTHTLHPHSLTPPPTHSTLSPPLTHAGNNAAHWALRDQNERMVQDLDLPPPRAATADEMFAIMQAKCPGFSLGKIPTGKKGGKKDAAKGKGKK
jgi:hypothetical protein